MLLRGDSIRDIHERVYKQTIELPKLYLFMEKVSNQAKKVIDRRKTKEENADILLLFFSRELFNTKARKLINHTLMENSEKKKDKVIREYIDTSRDMGKWIYLASSHDDCAADHKPYQGKLYYDDKAPKNVVSYAKTHGMKSIQWVMDKPAWFITRPNCRHFFKSIRLDTVKQYSLEELKKKYKTHRSEGDKSLATPKKVVIEQYFDRLHMLKGLYSKQKTERLRREIQKIELLIKKWKNNL